jgi:Flp pilus assembly protein protease CpaA
LALGALAGYPARMLSRRLIEDRVESVPESRLMQGRYSLPLWMSASSLGWCAIALALPTASAAQLAYTIAIFEIVLCISAVDGLIRKIPNELLISLILMFLASRLTEGGFTGIKSNLFGAILASVVFLVPSRLGLNIGWGDVKYAFVAGLCFGLLSFVQIMLVAAAGLGVYAVYLYATKKGTLKSSAAMGPYISLGVVATMLFPILAGL